MNIEIDKNKRWGIIGTILFHVVLLFILVMISMKPPDPPRPSQGVEVNLGYSDQGMGDIQPDKPAETASQQPKPKPKSTEDDVATQDTEESIKLDDSGSEVKSNSKTEEKKIEKTSNKDWEFKEKNKSTDGGSEGITGEPGDQGKENGNPNSNNYSGDVGSGGEGDVAWTLVGRKVKKIIKPVNNSAEQGTVVVTIWVDGDGKVVNAKIKRNESNTSSSKLHKLAIEAAYKTSFDTDPNAIDDQKGTITYMFVL